MQNTSREFSLKKMFTAAAAVLLLLLCTLKEPPASAFKGKSANFSYFMLCEKQRQPKKKTPSKMYVKSKQNAVEKYIF